MGRIKSYLGPAIQVTPDDIGRYDDGTWGAEEKRDGNWAECQTDDTGCVISFTSRVGKPFGGDAVNGLMGLGTHLPKSTIIGELETGSQAATDRYRALGYRRFHVFDVINIAGQDLRHYSYEKRRQVVDEIVRTPDIGVTKRMPVVRQRLSDFETFYREVMADGGEGLVFKKLGSLYMPVNSDGKVEQWVKCKPLRTIDLVLCSLTTTLGGQTTGRWGFYKDGSLVDVLQANAPDTLLTPENKGQLVCEFKGSEQFKSGALRHAVWVRVRADKAPKECVGTVEVAKRTG